MKSETLKRKKKNQLQYKQNHITAAALTTGRGCSLQRQKMFSPFSPYNIQILNKLKTNFPPLKV